MRTLAIILSLFLTVAAWAKPDSPPSKIRTLRFIAPNEVHSAVYQKVLKNRTGAMVCVGTYRCFSNLLFGEFSDVYFYDMNSLTVEFNQWLWNQILEAPSRQDLVKRVFGSVADKVENAIQTSLKSGDVSTLRNLAENFPKRQRVKDPKTEALATSLENAILTFADSMLYAQDIDSVNQFFNSFFASDESFAKIKLKVQNTRAHFIQGNLADPIDARRLTMELRQVEQKISILDISNAWDTIARDTTLNLKMNIVLEILPFESDAKVLFTNYLRSGKKILGLLSSDFTETKDSFSYYSASVAHFRRTVLKSKLTQMILNSREHQLWLEKGFVLQGLIPHDLDYKCEQALKTAPNS